MRVREAPDGDAVCALVRASYLRGEIRKEPVACPMKTQRLFPDGTISVRRQIVEILKVEVMYAQNLFTRTSLVY